MITFKNTFTAIVAALAIGACAIAASSDASARQSLVQAFSGPSKPNTNPGGAGSAAGYSAPVVNGGSSGQVPPRK